MLPLEPEDSPRQRITDTSVLPGNPLANVSLQPPRGEVSPVSVRLWFRGILLWPFSGGHPLNGPTQPVEVSLDFEDAAQKILLKGIPVLDVRARAQLTDQNRDPHQRRLLSRMSEHFLRLRIEIKQVHPHIVHMPPI
ncbi:MAG TPA: hypothetical protein VL551_04230 [Actinospica sp.]|nr:hypothetical protein [Actinospica sp.]